MLIRASTSAPPETTRHYLEFRHAPLALSVPIISNKMHLYSMNHAVEEPAGDCCLYPPIPGIVTVVEHGLGGWESLNEIMADAEYQSRIRPDEEHMVKNIMDGWPQFIVIDEQQEIFDTKASSRTRMFDFVRRPTGMERQQFIARLEEDGVWASENPPYRQAVARRVHSVGGIGSAPTGQEGEAFDAVIEVWVADAARLAQLVAEQLVRRAAFCDPGRSFTTLTRESRIRG